MYPSKVSKFELKSFDFDCFIWPCIVFVHCSGMPDQEMFYHICWGHGKGSAVLYVLTPFPECVTISIMFTKLGANMWSMEHKTWMGSVSLWITKSIDDFGSCTIPKQWLHPTYMTNKCICSTSTQFLHPFIMYK